MVGVIALAAVALAFWLEPIPQDPSYHRFADGRTLLGIPNFWNVATNLPFLWIGILGIARRSRLRWAALRLPYLMLCVGAALVGFGSAWYHLSPSTPTLVWDRLPMTVAFMSLFAAVVQDRVSERWGRILLWPLIVAGVASIAWWYGSELAGHGDLRPYAVVQFLPMLLIPLVLALYRGQGLASAWLWAALGAYLLAKLAEHFDAVIFEVTGLLSGHSLKHLLAALAVWWLTRAFLANRHREAAPGSDTQKSPARAL